MTDSVSALYVGWIIMAVGLFGSTIVTKLIIDTLCKKEIDPVQPEVLVSMILPLLITLLPSLAIKEILLFLFVVLSFVYGGVFSTQITVRIAKALKIKILFV